MKFRLVPVLAFLCLLVLYWLFSSLFQAPGQRSAVIGGIGGKGTDDIDISFVWKSRPSNFALTCEPNNDYFVQLEGHNWNKWMAESHSVDETYLASHPATPRVPCNNYWHTGRQSCSPRFGSKAYTNYSIKAQCDAILDNGYERGRVIPPQFSRREGWPHLGSKAQANQNQALPLENGPFQSVSKIRGGTMSDIKDSKVHKSQWSLKYPLQSDGKVKELSTLELLAFLKLGNQMNEFAVNLGANDGATSDPVAELYHHGWSGVAVELESRFCAQLESNLADASEKVVIHCPVPATPVNIQSLLKGAPLDMDYLKIDIDSYDCDVLTSILTAGYRPKVIQMETGTIPPPIRFAAHYHEAYSRPHAQIFQAIGCSISYVQDLLDQFGQYDLIEASLDSIWVRSDALKRSSSSHTSLEKPQHQPTEEADMTTTKVRTSIATRLEKLEPLEAYVNGFWRYPWRRELHVWEIGTEHWFQLSSDQHRLAAIRDHMKCVEDCFHSSSESPFLFTLQLEPIRAATV